MLKKPTRLLHTEFADLDTMCEAVQAWDLDFQPLQSPSSAGPVAEVEQWESAEFRYDFAAIRTRMHQKGSSQPGRYSFALLDPGTHSIWWRGCDVGPDQVLVYTPGCEVDCVAGPDFAVQILSVSSDQIEEIAERAGRHHPNLTRLPYAFTPPPYQVRRARAELSGIRFRKGVDLSGVAEALILGWLSRAGFGHRPRRESSSDQAVRRCLEAGWDGPVDIGAVCQAADVSRRTLETAFRARFGMGPAALMKRRRLAQARRMLLRAGPKDIRVADAMSAMGFSHVGQFATDYRRLFGELPSDTLFRA